ncbi:MAG TPA: glycosyltransferase family 4 protein [Methylomirabilota bacterium]|jgi:glycosyltransferase involved in cell wall biosynthesis|nr:glycosyltransferase family 4 protein [Methylomirabilota bacterium]
MRILFVAPRLPYLPCHDAARLAASHLVAALAERHTVAVVAATGGSDTPAQRGWLAARTACAETVPAGRWRTLAGRPGPGLAALDLLTRRVAASFLPDVIHLEGTLLAPLARAADAPTVLACHESATLRARDARRAGQRPWRRLAARVDERIETAWAREWLGAATACVADSEEDRQALAEHVPFERIDVLPAGIDDTNHAYRRSGEPARLVFTGDLAAPRDAEAARRLAGAILPRVRREVPRAELLVAGTGGAADARALGALPGVRVTGGLTDLRASVWGAAVYVSPLGAGFGRKARLLEPMALGTPVVASPPSLSGMSDALPGHHLMVADGDGEFADAIRLLLGEPVVANTIARNARELVERAFTWRTVARRWEALYARVAATPVPLEIAA